jgi:hypothetical protein
MSFGLHVLKNPAGTFSFFGDVPSALANLVPATKADVMGGRAFKDHDFGTGGLLTYRFPVFHSRDAAIDYADVRGFPVISEAGAAS